MYPTISQIARLTRSHRPSGATRAIPIGAASNAVRNRSSPSWRAASARFRSVTSQAVYANRGPDPARPGSGETVAVSHCPAPGTGNSNWTGRPSRALSW